MPVDIMTLNPDESNQSMNHPNVMLPLCLYEYTRMKMVLLLLGFSETCKEV